MKKNVKTNMPHSDEAKKYLEVVHHDDRDSIYFVASKTSEKFVERKAIKENIADEIAHLTTKPGSDIYVTVNGFVRPYGGRNTANVRQVNGIFVDVDAHGLTGDALALAVCQGLESIRSAVEAGNIPVPTMIVHSGRGIHMYYVYRDSIPYMLAPQKPNIKGMICHRMFVDALYARIWNVISGTGLSVDQACSDLSRYVRVPGTINTKTGAMCHLIEANGPFYTFAELSCALD